MSMQGTRALATILCTCALLGTSAARAVDGVIEINHTAITAGAGYPFVIGPGAPTSYVLTSDLTPPASTSAIDINRSGITIDLNGFQVLGAGGAGIVPGIDASDAAASDFKIFNGQISGFSGDGILGGIFAGATGCELHDLLIRDNGDDGIEDVVNCVIRDNVVTANGDEGIEATNSKVIDNVSTGNGNDGIHVLGSVVVDNEVSGNAQDGIDSDGSSTILQNAVHGNTDTGIECPDGCTINGNTVAGNGCDGIECRPGSCQIGANSVNSNNGSGACFAGIYVTTGSNVHGNSVSEPLGATVGLTITGGGSTGFFDNTLFGAGADTSPFANPTGMENFCVTAGGTCP